MLWSKKTITTKETIVSAIKNRFPDKHLFFSLDDFQSGLSIPSEWHDFGIKSDLTDDAWYPAAWDYYSTHLPWTYAVIRKCLIGTAILYTNQPNLVYIFHDREDYYFYIGKPSFGALDPTPLASFKNLPTHNDLAGFYRRLHNGFTFHPSNSMGPLALEDQPKLIDLYDGSTPPFSHNSIGVFHNGAGDYLAISSEANTEQVFIWWHENPDVPETGLNLWAVMDNWISIFLEDTKVLRD